MRCVLKEDGCVKLKGDPRNHFFKAGSEVDLDESVPLPWFAEPLAVAQDTTSEAQTEQGGDGVEPASAPDAPKKKKK